MFQTQIIHTPDGGDLVVLAKADYDALIERLREAEEDAADVAAYDAAKSGLGHQRITPPEVAAYLLKGDSLLKAWRKHRGLTQAELAAQAEIGQGYLSELENREKKGSPATMHDLAVALKIDPEWLEGLNP